MHIRPFKLLRAHRTSLQYSNPSNSSIRRTYATATTIPEIYDVLIVGGGPAGLSLATALRTSRATSRLKIGLIEAQDITNNTAENSQDLFSNRCSSLTPTSAAFLNEIQAWQHLDHSRAQHYSRMNVWDGVSGSRITFDWATASGIMPSFSSKPVPSTTSSRTIATMVENSNTTSALLARLKEVGGISIHSPVRVESIELGEDMKDMDLRSWPILRLSSGTTLAARLLVGADGPNSPVRSFAGIDSKGWDYDRHALVATLRNHTPPKSQEQTAYQRFLPTGPIALLPLPGPYTTLVWSTTPSNAAHLKSLSEQDFTAMVNAAFRLSPVDLEFMHTIPSGQADELDWRENHTFYDKALVPGTVTGVQQGSIASFPLKMRHADTYVGERVALVGDAAHSIHPLAGQGLNLGLADAAALASTVEAAAECGADLGSTLSLESYNASRYTANHIMLGTVDKLHKLYSFQSGPIVTARSLGLDLIEKWGGLKGLMMTQAAGPRAMR